METRLLSPTLLHLPACAALRRGFASHVEAEGEDGPMEEREKSRSLMQPCASLRPFRIVIGVGICSNHGEDFPRLATCYAV